MTYVDNNMNIVKAVINGMNCYIIINDNNFPTIYLGEMKDSSGDNKVFHDLCGDIKCNYVIYEVDDWNSAFSPWEFTVNKKMSFSGSGRNTLNWLVNDCIPYCEKGYDLIGNRILCGYSLAGLFSLWAFYESQLFSGVISCSGSLWFRDWIRYAEKHTAPSDSSVYLSLGESEEKTRNVVMAQVGECTRRQYELICNDKNVSRHIMELNEGGHFKDPMKRIVKGIKWMIC